MTRSMSSEPNEASHRRPLNAWRQERQIERICFHCNRNELSLIDDRELKHFVQDLRTCIGFMCSGMQFRVEFSKYLKTQAEIKQNVEWLKCSAITLRAWPFLTTIELEAAERGIQLPVWKNGKRWKQLLDFLTMESGVVN